MLITHNDDGVRPAGSPDRCFYCGEPKGVPHDPECVIPKRTVVLSMTIEYVVTVPANWDTGMIESHRNESSWCSCNDVEVIAAQAEAAGEGVCNTCCRTSFSFVREATAEDMEEMGYNAAAKLGAE